MAQSVPRECFYLRFGEWENHLWLQRLTEEFGGDLGRMIQLRGYKSRIQSKFLNQLAIESSEFDKLFGGRLIKDVGVVGMDTYFDNGAAIGILLNASDSKLLSSNLRSKRKAFAKAHAEDGATITTETLDGQEVELLATPDNRYRSFYAVAGDNHLMTTSMNSNSRAISYRCRGKTRCLSICQRPLYNNCSNPSFKSNFVVETKL